MSAGSDGDAPGRGRRVADLLEREPVWAREFTDPRYEWRRWFSELFGTFLLVLAGGGAPVVDTLSQGAIGRVAAAAAPALTVLAVILFMGAVSGAHLNPVVTIAFQPARGCRMAPRTRLPRRPAGRGGGGRALLRALFGQHANAGLTLPGAGFTLGQAFAVEAVCRVSRAGRRTWVSTWPPSQARRRPSCR
jgi:aquaporin Z